MCNHVLLRTCVKLPYTTVYRMITEIVCWATVR